jgi:hypothetical protein
MLSRWLYRLTLALVSLILLLAILLWLASSSAPVPAKTLSSQDLQMAQQLLKQVRAELRNHSGRIALTFDQQQLDALMNVAGYTLPYAHFSSHLTDQELVITATMALNGSGRTLQAQCELQPNDNHFGFSQCQLGKLPLPGYLSNYLFRQLVSTLVASPADQQLLQLFAKGRLEPGRLHFIDHNAAPILLGSHSLLATPATLLQAEHLLAPDLLYYLSTLSHLQREHPNERRLAFYALHLLQLAKQRTATNDISQFHSATWALITAFGNKKFAHFANSDIPQRQLPSYRSVVLAGREDLALHFLYSAALELLSTAAISAQMGNLKERLDASGKGSGFSFVDLAADKAGIAFAEQLDTLLHKDLSRYNGLTFERAIMPAVEDLPENLTELQLQQQFGGYQGAAFQQLEQRIAERILTLALYADERP